MHPRCNPQLLRFPCCHFNDGARASTTGEPPGGEIGHHSQDVPVSLEEKHINRVGHGAGVDARAGSQQQRLTRRRIRARQQASGTLEQALGTTDVGNDRLTVGTETTFFHNVPWERNFITSGKARMMNVTGKINNTSGATSFTGASMASFSAT